MSFGDKLLFFFSALGAFNGLLLSINFFFFPAKKHLSNYLLGALLLMLSIRIGKSVAYFFDYNLPKAYLQVGLTACLLIGPFLYYYIKSEIKQIRKLPKEWIWQVAAWLAIIILGGSMYSYERFPWLWGHYIVPIIYLQWGVYIGFSIALLLPLLKKMVRKERLRPFEYSLLVVCGGVFILFITYVWAYLNFNKGSYIIGAIYFSLIIYIVISVLLYRKKTSDLSYFSAQKYIDKKLDPQQAQLAVSKLKSVIANKELFKNPNLKINDLAKEINVSGHELSQLLNDNIGKGFNLFVNEYRINEACKMLSTHPNLTIDAIGDEVGFNAKSTFFSTFKKIKGVSPSVYRASNSTDL
ncbi:AraC family transcriptional regulator [Dyadobacter sp. CY356]|uniref:helix-turn-helix domain-containing protein n=1 Tax=Dyadobacter sp. CY356 TaxID=2906442 RepID=UPI001F2931C2|nr:helix-turn-helix domain-containing protein [Dyadobacter sp. CY356]MCF0055219.1 helix-turn-helix domain-containing protein [Dyadobacter sp. CY356]